MAYDEVVPFSDLNAMGSILATAPLAELVARADLELRGRVRRRRPHRRPRRDTTEEIERLGNDPQPRNGRAGVRLRPGRGDVSGQRLDAAVGSLPRGGGDRVRHRRAADRGTGRRARHVGAAQAGQHPPGSRAAAHRSPRCPAGSGRPGGMLWRPWRRRGRVGAVEPLSHRCRPGCPASHRGLPSIPRSCSSAGWRIIVVTVASAAISGLTPAPTPARCTDVPRGWRVPPPGWGWAPRLSRGCASRSAAKGVTRCRCEALSPRSPWRSPRSLPRSRSPTASSPCWIRPRGTGRGGTG